MSEGSFLINTQKTETPGIHRSIRTAETSSCQMDYPFNVPSAIILR